MFDDPAQPPTRANTKLKTAALSAAGNTVCVVSFGPAYQLQCLEQDTLRELWRVDLPNQVGAYQHLEQDAENVYVLAQGRALTFKLATGARLWATDEFRSGPFFKSFRPAFLTRNGHFALEWRDTSSGEVIAVWGERRRQRGFGSNAAKMGENVLVEMIDRDGGDGLWLLRVPNALKPRVRPAVPAEGAGRGPFRPRVRDAKRGAELAPPAAR